MPAFVSLSVTWTYTVHSYSFNGDSRRFLEREAGYTSPLTFWGNLCFLLACFDGPDMLGYLRRDKFTVRRNGNERGVSIVDEF
jgi:hypothetical protein